VTLHNIGTLSFDQEQYEAAIAPLYQAYQIFDKIGSPNKDTSGGYLQAIIEKIGEERFWEVVRAGE